MTELSQVFRYFFLELISLDKIPIGLSRGGETVRNTDARLMKVLDHFA